MNWKPHKATISHRVLQYLADLPPGKKIATGPLSEAMGQPSSAVINALQKPMHSGLVKRDRINGLYHWSIGDGIPLKTPKDDPLPKQVVKPVTASTMQETKTDQTIKSELKPMPKLPAEIDMEQDYIKALEDEVAGLRELLKKVNPLASTKHPETKEETMKESVTNKPVVEPFRFQYCSTEKITVIKGDQQVEMTMQECAEMIGFALRVWKFDGSDH